MGVVVAELVEEVGVWRGLGQDEGGEKENQPHVPIVAYILFTLE